MSKEIKKREIRNFYEYLETKVYEGTPVGQLAKYVVREVNLGSGDCFLGKNNNIGIMTRYMISLNASETAVDAVKPAYNEFMEIQKAEIRAYNEEKNSRRNNKFKK